MGRKTRSTRRLKLQRVRLMWFRLHLNLFFIVLQWEKIVVSDIIIHIDKMLFFYVCNNKSVMLIDMGFVKA